MPSAIGMVQSREILCDVISRRFFGQRIKTAAVTSNARTMGLSGPFGTRSTTDAPMTEPANPKKKPIGARGLSTPPFSQKLVAEDTAPNVAWPLLVASIVWGGSP